MKPPGWVENKLEPTLDATPDRKVLVVEGDDDEIVYRAAVDKVARAKGVLEGQVAVLAAGSKWAVLRGLRWLQDTGWWPAKGLDPKNLVAIVDRDEWEEPTIAAERKVLRQLRVNGDRHCLESYFCDPEELQQALFSKDKGKYEAPWDALHKEVNAQRPMWVPHWALWVTLHRAAAKLTQELEFPKAVLNERPLPKDGVIKQQLQEWAKVLDPKALFAAFEQTRDQAMRARHATQVRSRLHAGDFFNQVVLPLLQKCDPAVPPKDWMVQIVEWWPNLPSDLDGLLDGLVA